MPFISTLRRSPWPLGSLILAALALLAPAARAQSQESQSQSVAEAARRAREKKKAEKEPKKVITEDDLKPATPETVTTATGEGTRIPGAKPSEAKSENGEAASGAKPAAAADTDKDKAAKPSAEAETVKQQLAAAQKDLDLLQRELPLERDKYYSNTDYIHDSAGKAKLDSLAQQIADKKQEVEDLKAKLADLQQQ